MPKSGVDHGRFRRADIAAVSLGLLGVGITATPALAAADTVDITSVALTLTLEGNDARWSYAITGGDTSALTVTMIGEIGAFFENVPAGLTLFDGMMDLGFGGLAAAAGILLVATTRRRRA